MISRRMESLVLPDEKERVAESGLERDLTVEQIWSDQELFVSRAAWESLFNEAAVQNPFLSWGWISAWWCHFGAGKQLAVLFIRRRGELIGIAPFYQSDVRSLGMTFRALSLLGDQGVGSDYLDFLSRKGCEREVAEAVIGYLSKGAHGWDIITLRHLAHDSMHLPVLLGVSQRGWQVRQEEGEVCPYLTLPPTWDDYLNRLSSSMRYTIRRKLRALEREHRVEWVVLDQPESGRVGMERLIALHQKRWSEQGGSDAFVSEVKTPFHRETADYFFQKRIARLFSLQVDGETVAALYGFVVKDRFFYYQAGFDPAWKDKSVGMVLMAKCIQYAIAQRWSEFDFLRGPEAYKTHWTSDERRTVHLLLTPPQWKAGCYLTLRASERAARRWAGRLLPEGWIERMRQARRKRSVAEEQSYETGKSKR
ncbi:MAG: GNAT family N-acetyltransferase [Nitrospirae bacterium]|nr:GNAT family N-acetyltransferase [Candidatus Manganitrophaceae bacterium]